MAFRSFKDGDLSISANRLQSVLSLMIFSIQVDLEVGLAVLPHPRVNGLELFQFAMEPWILMRMQMRAIERRYPWP
jgi:hypothetical protein